MDIFTPTGEPVLVWLNGCLVRLKERMNSEGCKQFTLLNNGCKEVSTHDIELLDTVSVNVASIKTSIDLDYIFVSPGS